MKPIISDSIKTDFWVELKQLLLDFCCSFQTTLFCNSIIEIVGKIVF